MLRRALAILVLLPLLVAQDATETLLHRAFFVERGLEQPDQAIALYRELLARDPAHKVAGKAARLLIELLRKQGKTEAAEALARQHAAILAETLPVGINAQFVDPAADVQKFVDSFESESREIFTRRKEILALVGVEKGQAVADIGAGTGFFTNLLAREVGEDGKVYAVEIGPRIVEHLQRLARAMRLRQVEVVLCSETSCGLPPASIDLAFVCDTYHHFERVPETLASIWQALRPGGQLIVVDFHRIPGVSREWVFGHVRAGEEVFTAEIEARGFRKLRREDTPFLAENYLLRFEKPAGERPAAPEPRRN